jgi:hypothetical protein
MSSLKRSAVTMKNLEQRAADATPEPPQSRAEPVHAAADWREHDLMIRKFHRTGLVPGEIAVILNSKGLRVKTWAVSETFVRNRLKALGLAPNISRTVYAQGQNLYRNRPGSAD